MRLGVRAHDFGTYQPEVLADKIAARGINSIQLALAKALEGINTATGCQSPGLAYYIKEVFQKRNIQIAVLGCYINPIHPDTAERRRQLDRFKEHIRYARDFGCSIVATETGSYNPDCSYHPQNSSEEAYMMLLESVKELVAEAEKFGVIVCIEGVTSHVINTPSRMKRLLQDIDSNNLQVLFDPVNLISAENYENQTVMMKEAFELFGNRIAVIHAKDFIFTEGRKKAADAGKGTFDFRFLFKWLKENKPYINILMEDTNMSTIDESIAYLNKLFKEI